MEPDSKIEVRRFAANDMSSVAKICFDTGYMGESAECYWSHRDSFTHVWLSQYFQLEPESIFVAVKNRAVVGYLSGCVDSAGFPSILPLRRRKALQHGLFLRPGSAPYFYRLIWDAFTGARNRSSSEMPAPDLGRWPSHLHINLLPEARGCGVGEKLIAAWIQHLQFRGSSGCHLATIVENVRAVRFFEEQGFRREGGQSLVNGLRDDSGRRLHKQLMVRDL